MEAPRCARASVGPTGGVGVALRRFLPSFTHRYAPDAHTLQVLKRLSRCHTGEAGWSLWQCGACSAAHWRPLGCGDRHCPDCQNRRREDWLAKQKQSLLPVRYYHWVFTLPASLRAVALQNQASLYRLLFDAAAGTLLRFGWENFNAELGVTALLHTWGQNLMDHPHVHCLVTGGGLRCDQDGTKCWIGPKQARFLFPVKAVSTVFAGKFIEALQQLQQKGKLCLEGHLTELAKPEAWERFIAQLRSAKWVVFAKGSVAGPESVLEYLGRYTHRVAISNARIEQVDEAGVRFRYKDYRTGGTTRTMTLVGEEFVRRLSLHVLPEGFTKIRHYGLLGNNRRAKAVPLAREALRGSQWEHRLVVSPRIVAWITDQGLTCPRCQQAELLCVGRLDRNGKFTPLAAGARQLRIHTGDPPKLADTS
jgi:Putative transposase/Transposase zinc-binding domain